MATAAEGSHEGGAGGKFRRRPLRRAATPYDRPRSAIRNPIEAARTSWLSKLVDPASIITRSAQRLFSSVFRKSLPAPPTVSDANRESRDGFPEVGSFNPSSGAQDRVSNEGDDPCNSSDSNGINELEQILKQKTFTRAEIDRLTELLRSRTFDATAEDEKKKFEPSTSQLAAVHDRQELANIPVQENGMKNQRLREIISPPVVSSSVLEEDVASPTELAKAYMGSRSSKVSPSRLGLHRQEFREDPTLQTNIPFHPKSPSMSLVPRSAVCFAGGPGISENGYLTPRPRGRSAIYSMARTPYSRVHQTATFRGVGSTIDGNAGPSASSQWSLENNTHSGGKLVSKRRISVLDNDIGSIGPIRRIRQKTMTSPLKNMNLPIPGSPLSVPVNSVGSDAAEGSIQKPLLLNGPKHNTSTLRLAEDGDNSVPSTNFSSVPSQSSEMARRILQQLDKLVPSPKEKSFELKLATAREKSPTKLTHSIYQGQAFRSVEDVASPKLLHNVQGSGTLGGSTYVPGARDSTSQNQVRVYENGPTKIAVSGDKLASEANGVTTTSIKDSMPSSKTTDSVISNYVANSPPKKRACQISADEDSVDLDDDSFNTRLAPTPLVAEEEKLAISVAESKAIAAGPVIVGKPPVSSSKIEPPASLIFNKATDTRASDGPPVVEKDAGFTLPVTPAPSKITLPATPAHSPSLFNRPAPPKEPTSAPMFSFGSKNIDKAAPFAFSSTSSGVNESSVLKFGAQSDSKLEILSSTITVPATTTETTPKTVESDKGNKDKTQKAGDIFRQPENDFSSSVSKLTTPSILSFGVSTNNSSLNNGSLASIPSIFSAPAALPVSSSSTSNIFFSGATTTTTAATVTSVPSVSASSPTSLAAPVFRFGSSTSAAVTLSNSASQKSATSGIKSTYSEPKTKQASPLGSLSSSPFGTISSSPFTSTGNSIFGFGASAPSSTTDPSSSSNCQFQSSNPFGAAAAGPSFGAQVAPGTGVTPFTHSMPSQFVSSASSTTFGLSGSSTFSSGNSPFGSTTPGAKLFGSRSGFGPSPSMTSMGASSFSSGNGTTSLFSSSSQSETLSIFGSGSLSTSSATGFSFGVSSAAAATAGSAPMAFDSSLGASSGSIFSFTSAAATTSSPLSQSSPVFGAPNTVTSFGSASPSNDQMNMEDSMTEDAAHASTPAVPFGQPANSPPSTFLFGSPAPSGGPPLFQLGNQQNPLTPQNPSPFQAPGNLEFSARGSVSLGGGGDKSNRKFIKVRRDKLRKR